MSKLHVLKLNLAVCPLWRHTPTDIFALNEIFLTLFNFQSMIYSLTSQKVNLSIQAQRLHWVLPSSRNKKVLFEFYYRSR